MIIIRSGAIFNFINFCVIASFLSKLLTLGILFSIAERPTVVAKLLILGVFLTSFILALRTAVVAKLVVLGISFLISFILASRVVLALKLVASYILSSIFLIWALHTSF